MQLIHEVTKNLHIDEETVIALGNFDGFHIGHRELISTCGKMAEDKGLASLIFSFYPHPSHVLKHLEPVPILYTREEKKHIVEDLGVDYYVEYPFDIDTAQTDATTFVEEVLVKRLKVKAIVVGEHYRFGHKRKGDTDLLKSLSKIYGYEVVIINEVNHCSKRISSTEIRELVSQGNVGKVMDLLTRPYFIKGEVVSGKQLGRTLGFPTLNMHSRLHKLYPDLGVYVTRTWIHGKAYRSVTNVGHNPTVTDEEKLKIETFVLDFDEKIYGEEVVVEFLDRIRHEIKFDSLNALIQEMKEDVQYTERYFEERKEYV